MGLTLERRIVKVDRDYFYLIEYEIRDDFVFILRVLSYITFIF